MTLMRRVGGLIAWVTSDHSNEVLVVDLINKNIKNRILTGGPRGHGPFGIDVMPNDGRVYVTHPKLGNVLVINTTTQKIQATIYVGKRPEDIVIGPDGRFAYVLCSDTHEVYVIQTKTNTIVNVITLDSKPRNAAITPDGSCLYITTSKFWYQDTVYCASGKVLVINTKTNTVIDAIEFENGIYTSDVVFTPDCRYAYIGSPSVNNNNSIPVVDVDEKVIVDVIKDVTLSRFPDSTVDGMAVSPDGHLLYATDLNGYTLTVINTTTNKIIRKIEANHPDTYGGPRKVAFSPDGMFAYLLYWGGIPIHGGGGGHPGIIAIIDTNKTSWPQCLVGTIELGKPGAQEIVISPIR